MGCPYRKCHSPYGNAIEETWDPGILFPVRAEFFDSPPWPLLLSFVYLLFAIP
jgi:hypothetical protein